MKIFYHTSATATGGRDGHTRVDDSSLPLLYVLAQKNGNDKAVRFNDWLVGGSISMTSVLVG